LLAAGLLAGCAASGPAADGAAPADPTTASGSTAADVDAPDRRITADALMLIDRTDLRIGTTVQYARIPSPAELLDLRTVVGLAHLVLVLDEWPEGFTAIQHLGLVPPEADVIVVLRGYPPTRSAAESWNLVENRRLRLIVVAAGPPPSGDALTDLNLMRALERVIAEMEYPSRIGFERLQRPVSFRKIVR